ncbi:hypothetical protein ABDK00_003930 [Niabella insulamsoli]|uniref:hypothetical protein n=1 Tax=Niabella insulamsoli TaxID=3144874 RepID=UPI0031FCBFDC
MIDGKAVLYDGFWDAQRNGDFTLANGYRIRNEVQANTSAIEVIPNIRSSDNPTTAYIDWGNGDRDTLVCKMEKIRSDQYNLTKEVWFNGEKVYPDRAIEERAFKIVKDY